MRYLIFLSKDKDVAHGCKTCRFLTKEETCVADNRVNTKDKDGKTHEYRPYCCPFRFFDEECRQIVKRFDGMTEEETKGWFEGADWVYKHYVRLEKERDSYVDYLINVKGADKEDEDTNL